MLDEIVRSPLMPSAALMVCAAVVVTVVRAAFGYVQANARAVANERIAQRAMAREKTQRAAEPDGFSADAAKNGDPFDNRGLN